MFSTSQQNPGQKSTEVGLGHEPTSEEVKDDDHQPAHEPTSEEVKNDDQPRPRAGKSKAAEVVSVTSISFSYVCIPTLYIRPSDSRDY